MDTTVAIAASPDVRERAKQAILASRAFRVWAAFGVMPGDADEMDLVAGEAADAVLAALTER